MQNPATGNGGVRVANSSLDDSEYIAVPRPSIKSNPDVPPNWRRLDHLVDDLLLKLVSESEES